MSAETNRVSKVAYWGGWAMSVVPCFLFFMGPVFYLSAPADFTKNIVESGYPAGAAAPLLVVETLAAILYLVPMTSVLGAILLTGYLGGAVATHVIKNEAPMSAPAIIIGIVIWGGLFLRDPRIRALIPIKR